MNIKIKKLSNLAEIPKYQTEGAACMDLVATSMEINRNTNQIKYGIGLALEIVLPTKFVNEQGDCYRESARIARKEGEKNKSQEFYQKAFELTTHQN